MSVLRNAVQGFLRKHFPPPLFSPLGRRDLYQHYEVLRKTCPLQYFWKRKVWTVSRYQDALGVLNQPDIFLSSGLEGVEKRLLGSDGLAHSRMRKIVSRAFAPSLVAALEGRIRTLTEDLVQDVVARGRCELMSELARPLPLQVIVSMLGMDPDRLEDYTRWNEAICAEDFGQLTPERRQEVARDIRECDSFLAEHLDRCRRGLCQGVVSEQVVPDLRDEEAVDMLKLLLVAGTVTTTNLIGNAVLALLKNPSVMEAARANLDAIPAVVEETLRFNSPALSVARRAARDTELAGVRLPANSVLFVLLGSANHTVEQFDDPDRFDIARDPRSHLAFGSGRHYCLGATLSRLEARIVLEALLSRSRTIESVVPLDQVESIEYTHLHGPKRLDLIVEPSL